jgi:hypothetical protein
VAFPEVAAGAVDQDVESIVVASERFDECADRWL